MNNSSINPVISIITPTYQHENYISGCIESVIKQSYTKWEMIIIDDGSTDRTAEIAMEYSGKDSRIRVIKQENIGIFRLSETYNKALKLSNGEYIAILEGDDYWIKDKLEKQIDAFGSDSGTVLCWGQAFGVNADNGEAIRTYPPAGSPDSIYYNNNPVGSILNIFLFRNCIPALTMMIRKETLVSIGGFQQTCGLPLIDLPTLYKLALKGRFVFIPECLGFWRIYPTQITKMYTAFMAEGCKCLALDCLNNKEIVQYLDKSVNEKRVRKYYQGLLVESYSRSGRYKLIRKEFKSARTDYLRSVFRYGVNKPVWKIRSLIGYIFSLFHKDVEGLSAFLGKTSYR